MGSLDTMAIRGVRRLHRAGRQAGSGGVAFFYSVKPFPAYSMRGQAKRLEARLQIISSYHISSLVSEA